MLLIWSSESMELLFVAQDYYHKAWSFACLPGRQHFSALSACHGRLSAAATSRHHLRWSLVQLAKFLKPEFRCSAEGTLVDQLLVDCDVGTVYRCALLVSHFVT